MRTLHAYAVRLAFLAPFACFAVPIGCSGNDDAAATATDGGVVEDVGRDVAVHDAGVDAAQALEPILGTLSACDDVVAQLSSTAPSLLENTLTFQAPETYTRDALSTGGQRLFDTPNAGGSSIQSEIMSFEVLHVCNGAELLKTETEVSYGAPIGGKSPITDFLVQIGTQKVGVSVTRAYKPVSMGYTVADATTLLTKKLEDIKLSSQRVLPADKWVKQILYVLAETPAQHDATKAAWEALPAATKADTIVVLTATDGGGFIYCDPDPPLGNECQ